MFVFRNLIIMLLLPLSAFTASAEYVIKDIVDLGSSRTFVSATQNRSGVFTAVIKEALTNPVSSRIGPQLSSVIRAIDAAGRETVPTHSIVRAIGICEQQQSLCRSDAGIFVTIFEHLD